MWTDYLISEWDGKAVSVVRGIDSPEQREEGIELVFADGSKLRLTLDASEPILKAWDAGEIDHPFQAPETDAEATWHQWVKALYDAATVKQVDYDLLAGPPRTDITTT